MSINQIKSATFWFTSPASENLSQFNTQDFTNTVEEIVGIALSKKVSRPPVRLRMLTRREEERIRFDFEADAEFTEAVWYSAVAAAVSHGGGNDEAGADWGLGKQIASRANSQRSIPEALRKNN